MATSSITKSFVVSDHNQAKFFANAIETSYNDSLQKTQKASLKVTHLKGSADVKAFMAKRNKNNG